MFITNQFTISVPLNGAAATNDVNAATGIAAGGPYNGAITAINAAGAPTAVAVGDEVNGLVTTQAVSVPFNATCNYYTLNFTGAVALGTNHVMKLTHFNLHISDFEYVLDYKVTTVETEATTDLVPIIPTIVCHYVRAQKAFFITLPNAAIANYTNTKNLILAVVFGRQN